MEAPEKELKINVNGITIAYTDSGTGTPPIIFIHGFPFDKSIWKPQVHALTHFYRVITYDIRGFGGSTSNNEIASIDLFASDLIAFMDELNIPKAIVCGLSMGGYILMNAIERNPERFQAVILNSTQCIADSQEAKDKSYYTIKQIETEGLENFAEGFTETAFSKSTLKHKQDLVQAIKKLILSAAVNTIASSLHALAQRRGTCTSLNNISIPVLIVCGKDDTLIPHSQSELLFGNISDSQIHIIENAGHLCNLEQAEEFTSHIHNFLPDFLS